MRTREGWAEWREGAGGDGIALLLLTAAVLCMWRQRKEGVRTFLEGRKGFSSIAKFCTCDAGEEKEVEGARTERLAPKTNMSLVCISLFVCVEQQRKKQEGRGCQVSRRRHLKVWFMGSNFEMMEGKKKPGLDMDLGDRSSIL